MRLKLHHIGGSFKVYESLVGQPKKLILEISDNDGDSMYILNKVDAKLLGTFIAVWLDKENG